MNYHFEYYSLKFSRTVSSLFEELLFISPKIFIRFRLAALHFHSFWYFLKSTSNQFLNSLEFIKKNFRKP